MFMAMARAAAMRSTCFRLNVGAVVVYDRSVVAIGYNGSAAGTDHCGGNGCQHYTPTGCKVIHAEVNALRRIDRPVRQADLYVTHSPCGACVELLLDGRIARVLYETAYRDHTPVRRLIDGQVQVLRVLPSGLMVDESTGELTP